MTYFLHFFLTIPGVLVADLSPFDATDENMDEYDDKLAAVFSSLENKIYRLKADVKNRKFRHHPGRLEENIISCSQHSVLQSSQEEEELSQTFSQQTLRPSTYR